MLLEESDAKGTHNHDEDSGRADLFVPAAITDTGCERDLNEDRYAVVECESGIAWLVCDGMGGSTGGELAAQLAIDAIRRDLENLPARPPDVALRSAILEANRVIVLRRQNQAFAQMGTTIVAALFSGADVVVGHVGDSRAYLVRDGAIQSLTTDHTYVQELVDKGHIRPEDALSHPQAHILTRCIGSEPALELSLERYWLWPLEGGAAPDKLVLCTDGLYSLVSEQEVATMASQESPQSACVKLVELAKSRGGFDNISVAIIPIGGQLRREPPPGYAGPVAHAATKSRRRSRSYQGGSQSLMRVLGIVGLLSFLAALVTVLAVTIWVSR